MIYRQRELVAQRPSSFPHERNVRNGRFENARAIRKKKIFHRGLVHSIGPRGGPKNYTARPRRAGPLLRSFSTKSLALAPVSVFASLPLSAPLTRHGAITG